MFSFIIPNSLWTTQGLGAILGADCAPAKIRLAFDDDGSGSTLADLWIEVDNPLSGHGVTVMHVEVDKAMLRSIADAIIRTAGRP